MRNFQGYFSRTFQDLKLQFPGLSTVSRTTVLFQDFPGPGIFKKKNPGLSRTFQKAWELCILNSDSHRSTPSFLNFVPNFTPC